GCSAGTGRIWSLGLRDVTYCVEFVFRLTVACIFARRVSAFTIIPLCVAVLFLIYRKVSGDYRIVACGEDFGDLLPGVHRSGEFRAKTNLYTRKSKRKWEDRKAQNQEEGRANRRVS